MSNTPKLRFPEFNGEWEKKRLEEICDPPKYGLNSAGIEFDGIHKYLRITDIDEITHTFSPTDITTPSEFNDEYLLNKNDIVFARTGASTGKTYLYDSNDGDLYFAGFLIKFHVKDANARFVFYQTLTHKYSKWVHVMSTRSGQPGINSEEYGSYKIKLPDIHEQQKIADFLSNVDSIITAETKILNTLQKKKKALMQKLFTRQLRFKSADDTDFPTWEEKKLGEVCETYSGGTPKSGTAEYYGGEIPFIRSGEISSNKTELFLTEKGMENSSAKMVSKGDILYALYGANSGLCSISKIDGAINQAILCIKTNENKRFLCNYLQYQREYFYSTYLQGGQGNLSGKLVESFIIPLPCLVEQQKIADCLSSMDSLIQTQQKVVTTWQQRKKALLQQMFI
ncbi:MAG: restriction endonuclease subunit S [Treponema sp.]|nr:restriction endonuclease subunit S [Treponema sp.]